MEYEIRFYYSKDKYDDFVFILNNIEDLKFNGRKYEKTSQYNHPSHEYDFYKKDIDGRFRIRKTVGETNSLCKVSWKRRLNDTYSSKINSEEEVELNIDFNEYDNLIYLLENVLHLKEIECYERYRTTFINDGIEISLDEYPFGLALEIEAKTNYNVEEVIDKYVKLLNLNYEESYRLSWDDKYEELCKEQGIDKSNKVLFGNTMPVLK